MLFIRDNMSDLSKEAELAVKKLLQSDEEQLYQELAIRNRNLEEDPSKGNSFDPENIISDEKHAGLLDDAIEIGQNLFNSWNEQAFQLTCGSEPDNKKDREELLNAFGVSNVAVAAALSALLVTNLGLPAALAAVVAALAVKRFFNPVYEVFCSAWKERSP